MVTLEYLLRLGIEGAFSFPEAVGAPWDQTCLNNQGKVGCCSNAIVAA